MKKQVKILSIVLMIITIMFTISSVVFGSNLWNTWTSTEPTDPANPGLKEVFNFGRTIVTILQAVGIVVAVVVILVIGIKYIMGSAEEKAEYKKTMIPYLVGAVLIFGATTIVNVVYNLSNSVNSTDTQQHIVQDKDVRQQKN